MGQATFLRMKRCQETFHSAWRGSGPFGLAGLSGLFGLFGSTNEEQKGDRLS